MRRQRAGTSAGVAAALAVGASAAHGQAACTADARTPPAARTAADAPTRWPAPLDRPVTVELRGVPLADALAQVQAAARVRLSYALETLPSGRVVCLARERTPVGDVLAELLRGAPVAPLVAGADHVVLAPAQPAVVGDSTPAYARRTGVLERVVVTGSAMGAALGAPERALPVAVAVVPGSALGRAGGATLGGALAGALDGAVPGVWAWAQPPASLVASYASVRGASSFGVTSPKVYVDGIEVANPLLLTRLDPATVERLEVIRGPQGAALYGADAISGVVNVVTRRDGAPDGAAFTLATRAGAARSDFLTPGAPGATGSVLAQEHALTVRGGRGARTLGLSAAVGTLGAYLPGASSRTLRLGGSARAVGRRSILAATLRYGDDVVGAAVNPLLAALQRPAPPSQPGRAPRELVGLVAGDSVGRQALRQYTLGGSATLTSAGRWTHAVVAGLDGYQLTGAATGALPLLSPTDSAVRAAEGATHRLTLRASSVARFGTPEGAAGTLTLTLDQSTARDATRGAPRTTGRGVIRSAPGRSGAALPTASVTEVEWWNTTGLVAQGGAAWRETLYLSGGVRVERNGASFGAAQYAALPMLGASVVRELGSPLGASDGPLTLKLRAAYGKGIRPARTLSRTVSWIGRLPVGPGASLAASGGAALGPEAQAGIEAGVDVLLGARAALHVTRFDQRASGLIQPVAVVVDEAPGPRTPARRLGYVLQNVGAITNRGWELAGSYHAGTLQIGDAALGALSLSGTLALVASDVARLARGYQGELRAGDRMLGVPARTASASAAWTRGRLASTWTVSRAFDWIGYDRLALGAALAGDTRAAREFVGPALRTYWRAYPGVTRVGAEASWQLARGVGLSVAADNLLDRQLGEPDNGTILPGRTITAGLRLGR